MRALSNIAALAANTLREAVRNRLLYTLLFFAVGLIGAGVVLSSLSYVESERILQDFGFAAMRLFAVAIAIFVGVNLIHKEVERRTVYTILSKPISRAEFLLGKYAGLVLAVWLQTAIMVLAFCIVSLGTGAPLSVGHLLAFALIGVELALVVAIATFFSAFTTPMLASFFSAGLWIVGRSTRQLREIGAGSDLESVRETTAWLHRVLPDLASFDFTLQAAHGLPATASDFWLPLIYGAGYATVVLVAAIAIFDRRDFR